MHPERYKWTRLLRAPEGGAGGGSGDGTGAPAGGDGTGGAGAPPGAGAAAGAGAGDGGAEGAGAKDGGGAAPDKWMLDLGLDDLTRGEIAKAGIKDAPTLAKNWVEAQKAIGKKGVLLPGDKDPAEAWDKVYDQLGRPKDASGYTFVLPEGREPTDADQAFHGRMGQIFHKAGVTARQAEALNAGWNAYTDELAAAQKQAVDAEEAALKKEWGADFGGRVAGAKAAIGQLLQEAGVDGTALDALESTIGYSATMKLADTLAKRVLGDGASPRGAGGTAMGLPGTPAAARAELARIRAEAQADPNHPYLNRRHPDHAALQDKVMQLEAKAAEGAPR